jgi:hypothetical protein
MSCRSKIPAVFAWLSCAVLAWGCATTQTLGDDDAFDAGGDTDADGGTDTGTDTGAGDSDSDTDGDTDGDTDSDTGTGCVDGDSDWWCADVDCNDSDSAISPGGTEIDSDSVDNDCDGNTDEADTGSDACSEESKFIYVVERDAKELYRFDPAALTFDLVGTLACGGSATPGSMGVTRGGVAYVLFSDEKLFEVDITDASCTATGYSDAATGFGAFGMGFSSDGNGSIDETLYVANATTLGTLDTTGWDITDVGPMSSQAEVTGTGAGELWAILPLEKRMVRLDKTTATEIESHTLPGFPAAANIDTFAFAHWGGSLWVFVREFGMGKTTDVYEFDQSYAFDKVLTDVGFVAVGAGVSTCAPITVE